MGESTRKRSGGRRYDADRAKRGTSTVLLYGERYGHEDPVVAAREAIFDVAHYLARDIGMPTALGALQRAIASLNEAPAESSRAL